MSTSKSRLSATGERTCGVVPVWRVALSVLTVLPDEESGAYSVVDKISVESFEAERRGRREDIVKFYVAGMKSLAIEF